MSVRITMANVNKSVSISQALMSVHAKMDYKLIQRMEKHVLVSFPQTTSKYYYMLFLFLIFFIIIFLTFFIIFYLFVRLSINCFPSDQQQPTTKPKWHQNDDDKSVRRWIGAE